MKREICRIEPRSAVRIGFFLAMLTGFVLGLIEGFILKFLAGSLGNWFPSGDAAGFSSLSGGAIFVLAIMTGLVFSILGAFAGGVGALFYNWVAGLFGGLEFTVTNDEPADPSESAEDGD